MTATTDAARKQKELVCVYKHVWNHTVVFLLPYLLMFSQSFQVRLEFLEDVPAVVMHRHIVEKLLQLPDKDTHAGRLRWQNDMAWLGYSK